MHLNIKKTCLYSSGVAFNGYCFFKAMEANQKYNAYLAKLPEDELEKLKARDWFLKQHGYFFGSGNALAERADIDMYNAKSVQEKEHILIQYRWAKLDASNPAWRRR